MQFVGENQMIDTSKPKQRSVLVVDDDRLVLATLAKGLRQAGYDIHQAVSAEDALRVLDESVPDIAILDVSMPGMSGIELAKILRERSAVPFLFLSAYGDAEIIRQAAESGAVGYLVKPVDTSQIVPSIEAGLARAEEISSLRRTEAHLTSALNSGRETSVAIGIVMERYRLEYQQAFEELRNFARLKRRTINDVAKEMIDVENVLNQLTKSRS
jgi:AmiR/NasT family two-component response regulator